MGVKKQKRAIFQKVWSILAISFRGAADGYYQMTITITFINELRAILLDISPACTSSPVTTGLSKSSVEEKRRKITGRLAAEVPWTTLHLCIKHLSESSLFLLTCQLPRLRGEHGRACAAKHEFCYNKTCLLFSIFTSENKTRMITLHIRLHWF